MASEISDLYEFDEYTLNVGSRTLWKGNELVSISPKSVEVLRFLLEHRGAIVSKRQIFDEVWADTFVEDGVLTQNIYTLRKVLGQDEKEGKQYIETVPRRGYRFTANVTKIGKTLPETDRESTGENGPAIKAYFAGTNAAALDEPADNEKSSRERHPLFSIIAAAGLLVLAAFGVFWLYPHAERNGTGLLAPIEQLKLQRLTDTGNIIYPTISPDGQLLAFVQLEADGQILLIQQIATGSTSQPVPASSKGFASLAFSPDGVYLYFRQTGVPASIYQVPILGGTPKIVAENVWGTFSLSPDGKKIVFVRRDAGTRRDLLIEANLDGSGERTISFTEPPAIYRGTPNWSPDGTKIAIAGLVRQETPVKLFIVDVETGGSSEMEVPEWRAVTNTLWMPNGEHIIVSARSQHESTSQLWMLKYPEGGVRRLTNDLESYFWLSTTRDGRSIVTRQQKITSNLWLFDASNEKQEVQLTFGGRTFDGYSGLDWTHDGRVIFSSTSGTITDLYSLSPETSDKIRLTEDAGRNNSVPTLTPDGNYLLFRSDRKGSYQIWRMDLDGRNPLQLTDTEEGVESTLFTALAPTGVNVYFRSRTAGRQNTWRVSIDGGAAEAVDGAVLPDGQTLLSASPDGRWLLVAAAGFDTETADDDRRIEAELVAADGSAKYKIKLPARRLLIKWSQDSSAFYYTDGPITATRIWRQTISDKTAEKLLEVPDRIFNFAPAGARGQFVMARGAIHGDAILITNLP